MNEGADDLAEADREIEKEGENSRWQERTTRVVYPYYDRNLRQWKKGTWTKTVRNADFLEQHGIRVEGTKPKGKKVQRN